MRKHSRLARYMPPIDARMTAIVRADCVAAARLEPSYTSRFECWLDVVFSREGRFAVVPFVQIDGPMLLLRESSPFLWPCHLDVSDSELEAIEATIEPWLKSVTLLDSVDREMLHIFAQDSETAATVGSARRANLLGAAPIDSVLMAAAPYIYAQRFAGGRTVGIASPDAANGAAILSASAREVRADLGGAERHDLARRWFGLDIYGDLARGYDVTVNVEGSDASIRVNAHAESASRQVSFVRPAFASIVCSFDPSDAEVVGQFSAVSSEPVLRAHTLPPAPVIGGSAGRIGLVVRDDGLRAPDADVDEAIALCAALRAQEFDAVVVVASAASVKDFDLIHVFGHRHAGQFLPLLEQARRAGVPAVVSAHLDDSVLEAAWGSAIFNMLLVGMFDDGSRASIERGLVERRLEYSDGSARGAPAFDPAAVRTMLSGVQAAVVSCEEEATRLRDQFGFSGAFRTVPGIRALVTPDAAPIGAMCGPDPYILVHAAVEPRSNQACIVRAAAARNLPCVIVGSVESGDYYQNMLAFAGPRTMWIPEETLTGPETTALYSGARVFADVGWTRRGASRLIRAAALGCGLVVSRTLPWAQAWEGLAEHVDPASLDEVTAGLTRAWERAPALAPLIASRTATACDPLRSLQAVLGAYAEAAAVSAR